MCETGCLKCIGICYHIQLVGNQRRKLNVAFPQSSPLSVNQSILSNVPRVRSLAIFQDQGTWHSQGIWEASASFFTGSGKSDVTRWRRTIALPVSNSRVGGAYGGMEWEWLPASQSDFSVTEGKWFVKVIKVTYVNGLRNQHAHHKLEFYATGKLYPYSNCECVTTFSAFF